MADLITLIANVALTLSFIIAVIFGVAQVRYAARDRRERLTLDTLRNFQTREFSELIHFVTSARLPQTAKEMEALGSEERVYLIQFGQQMESLGLLVSANLVNLDLVDKTLGSLVTTAWEKYKPVITDIRQRSPDPFLSEYFQWLAEQIDKRMRENPRKPYHMTSHS